MNCISNIDFSHRDYSGVKIIDVKINDFKLYMTNGYTSKNGRERFRAYSFQYCCAISFLSLDLYEGYICESNTDEYYKIIENLVHSNIESSQSSLMNIVHTIYKFAAEYDKTVQFSIERTIIAAYRLGIMCGERNQQTKFKELLGV